MQAAPAATHLHSRGGAPDPVVVFVDQAADPERAPRLVQVSMQVADGDHTRRRGQERGVRRCLPATKVQPVCNRVFRPRSITFLIGHQFAVSMATLPPCAATNSRYFGFSGPVQYLTNLLLASTQPGCAGTTTTCQNKHTDLKCGARLSERGMNYC